MSVRSTSSRVIRNDNLDDVYEYDWHLSRAQPPAQGKSRERRPKPRRPATDMPATSCAVCGGSENEDQVLLCDGEDCPNEIHLYCLQPPLTTIPEGEWFCPECDEVGNTTHLQEYLESHYADREAHHGAKHLKWLQKMHKSLTDDAQLHQQLTNMETFLAKNPSEFDPADPELLCKPIRLYCPKDMQYHHGRIIGRKQDENGAWEHLVQFKSGINNRSTGLLAWLTLTEHAVAIGMRLYWGKVPGFPYWPAQEYLRSSMELVAQGEKSHNRHKFLVFFGDATHAYLRSEVLYDFVEKLSEFAATAGTKQLQVSIVLAEAELEEQLAVARARDAFGYDYLEEEGAMANTTSLKDLRVAIDYPIQDEIICIQRKTVPLGLQGFEPVPLALDTSYLMPPSFHHALPAYTPDDAGKQPERQLGYVDIDPRTLRSKEDKQTTGGDLPFGVVKPFGLQALGWFDDGGAGGSEPESDVEPAEVVALVLERFRKQDKPIELGHSRRRRGRPPKVGIEDGSEGMEHPVPAQGPTPRKRRRRAQPQQPTSRSPRSFSSRRARQVEQEQEQEQERSIEEDSRVNSEESESEQSDSGDDDSQSSHDGVLEEEDDEEEVDEPLEPIPAHAMQPGRQRSPKQPRSLLKIEPFISKEDMFEGEEDEDLELVMQKPRGGNSDSEETNSPLPLLDARTSPSQSAVNSQLRIYADGDDDDDEEYDEPISVQPVKTVKQDTTKGAAAKSGAKAKEDAPKRGSKRQRAQEVPVVREREKFHLIAALFSAQPQASSEPSPKTAATSLARKPKLLGSDSGAKLTRNSKPAVNGVARSSTHPSLLQKASMEAQVHGAVSTTGATSSSDSGAGGAGGAGGVNSNSTVDAILEQFKQTIKSERSPVSGQPVAPEAPAIPDLQLSPATPAQLSPERTAPRPGRLAARRGRSSSTQGRIIQEGYSRHHDDHDHRTHQRRPSYSSTDMRVPVGGGPLTSRPAANYRTRHDSLTSTVDSSPAPRRRYIPNPRFQYEARERERQFGTGSLSSSSSRQSRYSQQYRGEDPRPARRYS